MMNTDISELDPLVGGQLSLGKMIEWGVPHGSFGRPIPIQFLRKLSEPCVWIYSNQDVSIYPLSLAALGVPLEKIFFIQASRPVRDLKPLFLENTFRFIVLDSPEKLYPGDLSFLAAKIREHQQGLFLLRPFYLSPKKGNPFAQYRFNCSFQHASQKFRVQVVKGKKLETIFLNKSQVLRS